MVARKSESILLGRQALGPAFFIGSAAEIGKNNDSRLAGENSGLERSITQARPRPAAARFQRLEMTFPVGSSGILNNVVGNGSSRRDTLARGPELGQPVTGSRPDRGRRSRGLVLNRHTA